MKGDDAVAWRGTIQWCFWKQERAKPDKKTPGGEQHALV